MPLLALYGLGQGLGLGIVAKKKHILSPHKAECFGQYFGPVDMRLHKQDPKRTYLGCSF